jgi:hypothetical protein
VELERTKSAHKITRDEPQLRPQYCPDYEEFSITGVMERAELCGR